MTAFRAKPPKGSLLRRGDPLAKGMVLAYPLWESGGPVAYDAAGGKAGNGTLTNFGFTSASGWVTREYGRALLFDGSDDYIAASTGAIAPGDFTFACRLRPSQTGSYGRVCGIGATAGSNNRLDCYQQNSPASIRADIYSSGGSPTTLDTAINLTAGGWYVYVLVVTAGGCLSYLNGTMATAAGVSRNGDSGTRRFGTDPANGNLYFSGAMDGICWWNRGLTAREVRDVTFDFFRPFRRRSVALLKATAAPVSPSVFLPAFAA